MLTRTEERRGHNAAIYDLQPAPGGFYSASADGLIVRWHRDDVDMGHAVAKVDDSKFLSLATLEDGGLVAGDLSGGVHWLYPDEPERNLHVAQHRLGVFAVLRVGDEVFTAGGDGVLTKWNANTGRTMESLPVSGNSLRCLDYEKTQDLLLVGASDGCVHQVPKAAFHVRRSLPANPPSVFTVAAHNAGAPFYLSGGRDARIKLMDLIDNREVKTIDAHNSTINDLAFSPNRRYLATASRDKTVKLWDAKNWKLLKVCEVIRDRGHVNSVNCLLWLDDETLVTAGDDRRILTWKF